MRTLVFILLSAFGTTCLHAQIVSNPVVTTFKPYASSGYVTPTARTTARVGISNPVTAYRYVPGAPVGQTCRPVMTYRVPAPRYYAAPQRLPVYGTRIAPPQVVYRVPVAGPPTPIITYYQPVRSAGMPVQGATTYTRPLTPSLRGMTPVAAPAAPAPPSTNCGCGGR